MLHIASKPKYLQIHIDPNRAPNDFYIKQVKGFAMGTKAAVNCANLTVGYLEVTMFDLLPTVYPTDFVDSLFGITSDFWTICSISG